MPKYIVSGIDERGRKVIEQLETPSALDAVQAFRDRGYERVSLETEGIDAVVNDQFNAMRPKGAKSTELTARERVEFRKLGRVGRFFFWLRKMSARTGLWIAIGVAIFVCRRLYGAPLDFLDMCSLMLVTLPLSGALLVVLTGTLNEYHRMLEDGSWARWERVLKRLPKLRKKLPPFELAVYEACALAGLGRVSEGLKLLEPFADGKTVPEWWFWGRMTEVYFACGDSQKLIECLQKGLEYAPTNPLLLLELAVAEIRFHHDDRAAKAILDQIQMDSVAEHTMSDLEMARGMSALETKSSAAAVEHFQVAYSIANEYAKSNPLMAANLDKIHAYLALAYAQSGDMEAARLHYKKAEKRIRTYKFQDIREDCEKALGHYAD